MSKKVYKRNINVELIRIIACCIVIGVHCKLPDFRDGVLSRGRLLVSCFLADGVAVFWMISGFFMFNKQLGKQAKKLVLGIVLPSFLVICMWQVFGNWFSGQSSFMECVKVHQFNVQEVFGNILFWQAGMTGGNHLWYVFSYVQNFLWVPLLNFVCKETAEARKVRHYLIGLAFLGVIINDIQLFTELPVGRILTYSVVSTSVMQMLIGYEIFIYRDWFRNKTYLTVAGLAVFLFGNLARCYFQYGLFMEDSSNNLLLFWQSGFGTLCAVALIVAGLSTNLERLNEHVRNLICWIGGRTFGIYLIHTAVITKLGSYGLGVFLENVFQCSISGIFGIALYTFVWMVLVFMISLAAVGILQMVMDSARLFWICLWERKQDG